MKKFKTIIFAFMALTSFVCMILPGVSETFITKVGPNASAAWSAICFVMFMFFYSGLSETTKDSVS